MTDAKPIAAEEFQAEQLEAWRWDLFFKATNTQYSPSFPLTLGTIFRSAEFVLMERLNLRIRDSLHIEQEYEYFGKLKVGDLPFVKTEVTEVRTRKVRSQFMTVCEVFTSVYVKEQLIVRGKAILLVRSQDGNPK